MKSNDILLAIALYSLAFEINCSIFEKELSRVFIFFKFANKSVNALSAPSIKSSSPNDTL